MIKRLKVLRAGWLIVLVPVLAACILDPLLARDQEFNRYGIAFQAPVGLKLDQYTLDMQREIFKRAPLIMTKALSSVARKTFSWHGYTNLNSLLNLQDFKSSTDLSFLSQQVLVSE